MSSPRLVGVVAVAALALGLPAVALALRLRTATRAAAAQTKRTPTSRRTTGVPEVGALFANASSTQHDCTATVVDSPRGDIVLTAAHCVSGSGVGMVFAPGYRNGTSPYGRWTVTALTLPPGWTRSQNPQDDFAFLTLASHRVDGRSVEIQQVTGAYQLGGRPRAGETVTVLGYPIASDDAITCQAPVYFTGAFPSFDCSGYVDGTSGGPWLVRTARGESIVGVIGGLNQGGCVASTSYTSLLIPAARTVYARAAADAAPDVAPAPRGDGCPSG